MTYFKVMNKISGTITAVFEENIATCDDFDRVFGGLAALKYESWQLIELEEYNQLKDTVANLSIR